MIWIPFIVFVAVVALIVTGYFLIVTGRLEKKEIKKRLSLLELRSLQIEDLPEVLKDELLSDVPVFQKALSKFNVAVEIDKRLKQANMEMRAGTFILMSCLLFGLGLVIGGILRWPFLLAVVFGALLFVGPTIFVNVKKSKREKKFILYFPEALEMFSRSLRAGHSFIGAIHLVGQEMPDPIGPEFKKVFDEQNLGIPLRVAMLSMTNRIAILDVKFFVTAVLIQRETGGNLAEIIDKIAYVIRERFRIQGQLKIHTAQARLTGIILSLLPIFVAFVLFMISPGYMAPLWSEPIGKTMIVVAIVLQITGMMVIRRIIKIKI